MPDDGHGVRGRTFRGGGLAQLREHNRAAALRLLLDHGPLSRTQLARTLDLTQPALSYITAELIQTGLIEEQDAPSATGHRGPGRQAVPLALAPAARCTVAVHIGATGLEVGLVDLRAVPVLKLAGRIDHRSWGPDPHGLALEVARQVRALTRRAGVPAGAVLGAGVGVAGWVDDGRGVVRRHEQLDWRDVPLAAYLSDALRLPVVLEDHVRAMALAEAWFGAGLAVDCLALLYVGAVVGCSLVFGRRVHRGHTAAAGVIGDLPTRPTSPVPAGTEARPAGLEAAVSEPAIERQARELVAQDPGSTLDRWLAETDAETGTTPRRVAPTHTLAELVTAASAEDDPGLRLLRRRAEALAPYVVHVIGTFDPELFAVAGPMAWDGEQLQLRLLRDAVVSHAPALADRLPVLAPSAFGATGALVGAAALVLQELFSPPLASQSSGGGNVAAAIRRRARYEK